MSDKNIPLNFHFKRWLGIHLEPESLYCLADAKIYNPFHFIEVFWWPIGDLREHLPRVSYKKPNKSILSGRSSGVERNLAKVEVEGSNPFARSKFYFISIWNLKTIIKHFHIFPIDLFDYFFCVIIKKFSIIFIPITFFLENI